MLCLAAAHVLVRLDDGTVVGDPMEKAGLEGLGWAVEKGECFCALLNIIVQHTSKSLVNDWLIFTEKYK